MGRDSGTIPDSDNRSGRAMNARASDALAKLRVETRECAPLRVILIARDEIEALRRAKKDARSSRNDGVGCERDDLCVRVAVLVVRAEEPRRHLAVVTVSKDIQVYEDVRGVRRRMKEGRIG